MKLKIEVKAYLVWNIPLWERDSVPVIAGISYGFSCVPPHRRYIQVLLPGNMNFSGKRIFADVIESV